MTAANKVALNTIILYGKMLITMAVSLFSTRLVLNALGAADFGIFNLIAGVIALLSFLNVAMTVSTQRFLSYHQGIGNFEMQKKIFKNSWILHIIIGLFVVILLLSLTSFLFNGFLNIPENKVEIAKYIYYFMAISVFFSIISVPFTASLNAHENMLWIAIVNIIEAGIKLAIALSLTWFVQSERLVIYGVLIAGLSLITFLLYMLYCLKKYKECHISSFKVDMPLIKELGVYAGWNMFGALCSLSRTQGLAVVLNIFWGTIINAAYGISNQVAGQVNFLSVTLQRALNPQIMKSEGMNDRFRMLKLSMMACKFGFFLLALIAVPCIFEMSSILSVWLKRVPEYTIIFCTLTLVGIMINQLTVGLQSAIQATGKIKIYQLTVGSVLLFNLPIAYFLLKKGYPVYFVLISYICVEIVASLLRLFFAMKIASLSVKTYLKRVLLKSIIPLLVLILVCFMVISFSDFEFRFIFTGMFSTIGFVVSIYFFGLCVDEKILVNQILVKIKKQIRIYKLANNKINEEYNKRS